jgi:hypothetical protein
MQQNSTTTATTTAATATTRQQTGSAEQYYFSGAGLVWRKVPTCNVVRTLDLCCWRIQRAKYVANVCCCLRYICIDVDKDNTGYSVNQIGKFCDRLIFAPAGGEIYKQSGLVKLLGWIGRSGAGINV